MADYVSPLDVTDHSLIGSQVTRYRHDRANLVSLLETQNARLTRMERDYRERRAGLLGRITQLEELIAALDATSVTIDEKVGESG